jgi:protein-S-isoprenylcysteine O-methyltransferase Ste14
MYLGFVLFIIGVWLLLGSLSSAFAALLFVMLLDRYYIPFEEAVLQEKFGESYLKYKKCVRRWI